MNISDFHTSKAHSKPRKMKLYSPNGESTEHFIMVLGRDSAPVRDAMASGKRAALEGHDVGEAVNALYVSMIDSWSFPEECTHEEKLDLLTKAPYIGDAIDAFSCRHENFAKK